MALKALIFDVDGTLADTEHAHLAAFNRAFADEGLDWQWDVPLYTKLLEVSGGKDCDPASGFLCLESEGSPVEFKEIRIRELP